MVSSSYYIMYFVYTLWRGEKINNFNKNLIVSECENSSLIIYLWFYY